MKGKYIIYIVIIIFSTLIPGCNSRSEKEEINTSFFGDKVLYISANNRPNGYNINILKTEVLCLAHLQKGDSVNVYIALPIFPKQLNDYYDSIGYYKEFIDVPYRTELSGDLFEMFFMDINFDQEPELVVSVPGYNRTYFWCYDIKNRDKYPTSGFLEPLKSEPFNNLVMSTYEDFPCAETVFDYDNKTIKIDESLGVGENITTIAEYYNPDDEQPSVRVTRKEIRKSSSEGIDMEIYALVNDSLKLIKHQHEAWD